MCLFQSCHKSWYSINIKNKEENYLNLQQHYFIATIICVFRVVLMGPVLGDYFFSVGNQHSPLKLKSVWCNDRVMQTPGPEQWPGQLSPGACHDNSERSCHERNGQVKQSSHSSTSKNAVCMCTWKVKMLGHDRILLCRQVIFRKFKTKMGEPKAFRTWELSLVSGEFWGGVRAC